MEEGYALHLRRRLTPSEVLLVGELVDVRGTEEGHRIMLEMKPYLPAGWVSEL